MEAGQLSDALIQRHPPGTRFLLADGVHRLTAPLRPRAQQEFHGLEGAVIRGSVPLETWTQDGRGHWFADHETQEFPRRPSVHEELRIDYCREEFPMCRHLEAVYLDGAPLQQVPNRSRLSSGTFFLDYELDRIYLADDPAARRIETPIAQQAFSGGGDDVLIRNLVIEQFASPTQAPAMVDDDGQRGWRIVDNELRYASSVALRTAGDHWLVRGNKVHSNGQMGVKGFGAGGIAEGNEISHNNIAGYRQGFESGGTKWVHTSGLVVRRNHVHSNFGNGLWTDIDNIDVTIEENLVDGNEFKGVFHEIGYDATIRNNIIRRNGWGSPIWFDGAGITISNSGNVEVHGNILRDNLSGITARQDARQGPGSHGPWVLSNISIRGNTVHHRDGSGPVGETGFAAGVAAGNWEDSNLVGEVRYLDNKYSVPEQTDSMFSWFGQRIAWSEWQALHPTDRLIDRTGAQADQFGSLDA